MVQQNSAVPVVFSAAYGAVTVEIGKIFRNGLVSNQIAISAALDPRSSHVMIAQILFWVFETIQNITKIQSSSDRTYYS